MACNTPEGAEEASSELGRVCTPPHWPLRVLEWPIETSESQFHISEANRNSYDINIDMCQAHLSKILYRNKDLVCPVMLSTKFLFIKGRLV